MAEKEERDRVTRLENEEGKDEVEAHRVVRDRVVRDETDEPRDDQSDDFEAHRKH